jgi:hypothetical protein
VENVVHEGGMMPKRRFRAFLARGVFNCQRAALSFCKTGGVLRIRDARSRTGVWEGAVLLGFLGEEFFIWGCGGVARGALISCAVAAGTQEGEAPEVMRALPLV